MLNSLRSARAFTAAAKKRPDREVANFLGFYALVKVDDDSESNDIFFIPISISWNRLCLEQ